MTRARRLSRRTILRGVGTAIALPWLEAMKPVSSAGEGAADVRPAPVRLAFLYVPNGAHMDAWTPKATGEKFVLPPTLQPLQTFQRDFS
jgi:hypothetical protein